MKIYTKRGDQGSTGLLAGASVFKDHPRIRTYGTFDELNAVLGFALAEVIPDMKLEKNLQRVQSELFQVGSELATPAGKAPPIRPLDAEQVQALEIEIDEMQAVLKPLEHFILPGGARLTAALHLARTVCRRAERELVALHHDEPVRAIVLEYVNRLGDYFFVCARYSNKLLGQEDTLWVPR